MDEYPIWFYVKPLSWSLAIRRAIRNAQEFDHAATHTPYPDVRAEFTIAAMREREYARTLLWMEEITMFEFDTDIAPPPLKMLVPILCALVVLAIGMLVWL